ncbi:MAG TPA: TVP38/TMEM64 family protein [Solirubrobacterales bacterium]|nr:TVP38/TMEM64 family protein [Solirubrobacterales bacterium]
MEGAKPQGALHEIAEEAKPRAPLREIVITLVGIALIAGLIALIPELRHAISAAFRGDNAEVREQIDNLGAWGPLLILALTLVHAVVFFPAEIVDAAAGYAYGFFPALALCLFGWVLSAIVAYAIGGSVGRPLLHRWLGAERFERIEGKIERGGVTLLLGVRLVPIFPFSLICYAAGAARVPFWRYVWTTAVGYLPITAAAVYLGTQLESLSLTDPLVLGTAALFLVLLFGGQWAMRRKGDRQEA